MCKLIGLARLGDDARLRQAGSGDSVANLSLAFNYGKKDAHGKQPTTWVDASLWGKRADSLAQYLVKGQQVFVVMSDVHIETYEGKNGQGHKLVARIDDIQFAGSRQDGQSQSQQRPAEQARSTQQQRQPAQQAAQLDDFEGDIPF